MISITLKSSGCKIKHHGKFGNALYYDSSDTTNDVTISFAAEAGQLQLNVMEPVIVRSIFESMEMLKKAKAKK